MISHFSLPIPITGLGCITAAGRDRTAAYTSIENGTVCNQDAGGAFFPEGTVAPCFRAAEELTPLLSLDEHIAIPTLGINRTILLALTAIEEALLEADLSLQELRQKRVAVVLGTTVGCSFHNEEYYQLWREGIEPEPEPLFNYLLSNLAGRIQEILGLRGPRLVITNACASGTDAIGVARSWLQDGLCDIAIAGGADELSKVACYGFKSLMLVSEKSCIPFDRNRKGLNLGEGAGIYLMESPEHLAKRGARAKGFLRGYGIAGDAHHPTAPHPKGRGLQLAVTKALADAGVSIDDIAMINAHGTGTPANDLAETSAIQALGFKAKSLPVISTKGATGHTLGAAGGVEAVFTLMALNRGELYGSIGCKEPDPALSFQVLPQGEKAVLNGKIGLSQSLAFGGSNSALVIEGVGP